MGSAYSENIIGDNTVNSTSNNNTTQKKFNADGTSLTISESTTLSTDSSQTVNIFTKNNGTVTVESGSSIFSNGALSSNAFEESAPLEKIEDPDSTVTVPLFFVKIFTVCDESVDKVVDSEIVKDVPSALNFFWVVLLLLVLFTVLSPIIFSE